MTLEDFAGRGVGGSLFFAAETVPSALDVVRVSAGDGFAQGVHQVDDLAAFRLGGFVLWDGQVFDLGFDELFEGDLVTVGELRWVELGGAFFLLVIRRVRASPRRP